jgi:hypothetical protein
MLALVVAQSMQRFRDLMVQLIKFGVVSLEAMALLLLYPLQCGRLVLLV